MHWMSDLNAEQKDRFLGECKEIGVIYYKNTSSTVLSENILPLYVNGEDSKTDEYIKYMRVEPEEEYVWKPYLVKDDLKTTYKSSSFHVGKAFSVVSVRLEKGCVGLEVTAPFATDIYYLCTDKQQYAISIEKVIEEGLHRTLKYNGQYYISAQLKEDTHYYLYLVAQKGVSDYTEVQEYEFETGKFVDEEMLVLQNVGYDGFTMRINMPSSVKTSEYGVADSRAIRYAFGNLLMYNMNRSTGWNDYSTLLCNGAKYLQKDCMLDVSDKNMMVNVDYDVNKDGVIDENDVDYQWNPITPGEPVQPQ